MVTKKDLIEKIANLPDDSILNTSTMLHIVHGEEVEILTISIYKRSGRGKWGNKDMVEPEREVNGDG